MGEIQLSVVSTLLTDVSFSDYCIRPYIIRPLHVRIKILHTPLIYLRLTITLAFPPYLLHLQGLIIYIM